MTLGPNTVGKHSSPLVWLVTSLLLLFPVSGHALAGIVLCVESDGRIELESSRGGDCASNVFAVAQEVHADYAAAQIEVVAGEDCPNPCFDILLLASPADGQAASAQSVGSNDTPRVAVSATAYPASLTRGAVNVDRGDRQAPVISPVAQLRTIVLQI